jgi:hypothetical protein
MKKLKILLLALCLVFGLYTGAQAASAFAVFNFYDQSGNFLETHTMSGTGNFSFSSLTGSFGAVTGSWNANADPRVEYSFGFVNGAAPIAFDFFFVTPAIPGLTGKTFGNAELVVGITDNGIIGWSLNNFAIPIGLQQNYADLVAPPPLAFTAVPFAPLGGIGPYIGAGAASGVFATAGDPFFAIPGPFLAGLYPWFFTEVSALVSADDGFTFTGNCQLAPIPGSLLLLGSGILGLVGVGVRRKSS